MDGRQQEADRNFLGPIRFPVTGHTSPQHVTSAVCL